jgi:hypothetical protein
MIVVVRCHGSLLIVLDFDLAFSDRASSNWRVKWAFPVFFDYLKRRKNTELMRQIWSKEV